ncbi:sex peptide receptor-like [Lingula anatina]|uniref:Sex peptide receptor-like n=1 Tax=Lingula anatina TaxID=7574 RepID=A0A1S3JFU0_LINAN|nr:sex peptide receptor-like [Lingula anatina]|eukprot:XP_013409267.1 sex peptide receptor-like [Lingula anatina]
MANYDTIVYSVSNSTELVSNIALLVNATFFPEGTENTSNDCMENSTLKRFSDGYEQIHGYLSILICFVGIICNILNVIVLTRKNMISPTNYILSALAIADLLTMVPYLPLAFMYCLEGRGNVLSIDVPRSLSIILINLMNNVISITMHSVAMWLTVALAFFRYIIVCHGRTHAPKLCSLYRTKLTIAAICIFTLLFLIPNFLCLKVTPKRGNQGQQLYMLEAGAICTDNFLVNLKFWLYGVGVKIATCILLVIFSGLLIKAIHSANQRRRKLLFQGRRAESEYTHEHNRTTTMLVTVVLLFVVTELPQGILLLMIGISENKAQSAWCVYFDLADFLDMIVLLNSSINFMLYCTMSQQFRNTFKSLFIKKITHRLNSMSVRHSGSGPRLRSNGHPYDAIPSNNGNVSCITNEEKTMNTTL